MVTMTKKEFLEREAEAVDHGDLYFSGEFERAYPFRAILKCRYCSYTKAYSPLAEVQFVTRNHGENFFDKHSATITPFVISAELQEEVWDIDMSAWKAAVVEAARELGRDVGPQDFIFTANHMDIRPVDDPPTIPQ